MPNHYDNFQVGGDHYANKLDCARFAMKLSLVAPQAGLESTMWNVTKYVTRTKEGVDYKEDCEKAISCLRMWDEFLRSDRPYACQATDGAYVPFNLITEFTKQFPSINMLLTQVIICTITRDIQGAINAVRAVCDIKKLGV